jgi:methylmalonic aciduria homocystinuria type C protein
MRTWRDARALLQERIEARGFEVLGAVASEAYNASLEDALAAYRIPSLGAGETVALVVGNTRRLWPLFIEAYASTEVGREQHPLDAYSRLHITRAAEAIGQELGIAHLVRFSFDPPPHTVAIQRLAALAGAAELAPIGLCVHPSYGPWLSLRAVIVLALPGPEPSAPAAPTCSRCEAKPCLGPREKVMAMGAAEVTRERLAEHWETWLAMRDACPIGRAARYSDQQIRYHYLKDRSALEPTAR